MTTLMMSNELYTIFCDGGNKKGVIYGSFKVFAHDGAEVTHKQIVFGEGTSNLAEYLTLIEALRYTRRRDYKNIVVFTDSALVKHQIEGKWKCNYDHLKRARNTARKILKDFDSWKIKHTARNTIVGILGH